MSFELRLPALRVERRFADAILEGRKAWEFRRRPLGIGAVPYLLCLEDAGDRVVGAVDFAAVVATYRVLLLSLVTAPPFSRWRKCTGLPAGWLESYAGPAEIVYAHHIAGVARFSLPAGGHYSRGCLVFRSGDRDLLEKIQREVHDKVASLRVSLADMLDARKESRHA